MQRGPMMAPFKMRIEMTELTEKITDLEARDNERARLVHNLKVSLNIETLLQGLGVSFSWKDYEKPLQLSIRCISNSVVAVVFEGERIALPAPIPMAEWSADYRAR